MTNASKAVRGALLTARRVTRTAGGVASDEFKRWFGKSVAHDNGVPRRYFTGTSKDKDFDKFNVSRHGAWFTTDPKEASQYAVENDSMGLQQIPGTFDFKKVNHAARVIPAYLRLENPYTGDRPPQITQMNNYKKAQSDWFDYLRRQGHDSWVPDSLGGNLAVALHHPSQIKSAVSNTGAYGPQEGRIGRDAGGAVQAQDDPSWPTVYHGSPHYFSQFDNRKIGTGEGAQAYGHGMYFAENEDIAKGYRNRLSKDATPYIDLGTGRGPENLDDAVTREKLDPSHRWTLSDFMEAGGDWDKAHKYIADTYMPQYIAQNQKDMAELRGKYPNATRHKPGHMYEVKIKAHPEHFLHWDKQHEDQHPHVQEKLAELGIKAPKDSYNIRQVDNGYVVDYLDDKNKWGSSVAFKDRAIAERNARITMKMMGRSLNGMEIHRQLAESLGGKPQAAAAMQAAGIPGIRYFDAASRGAAKGNHNFVVFDDKTPEIKRRYERGGGV